MNFNSNREINIKILILKILKEEEILKLSLEKKKKILLNQIIKNFNLTNTYPVSNLDPNLCLDLCPNLYPNLCPNLCPNLYPSSNLYLCPNLYPSSNLSSNLDLGPGTGINICDRNLLNTIETNITIYSSFDIPFKFDNILNSIKDIKKGIGITNKKYLAHNTIENKIKLITYNIQNKDKKYNTNVYDDFNSKKFSPEHKNMIHNGILSIWPKLNIAINSKLIVMIVDKNTNTNTFRYTFFRVYTGNNFICEENVKNIKYVEWQKSNNII
jgi:hypothetical protein